MMRDHIKKVRYAIQSYSPRSQEIIALCCSVVRVWKLDSGVGATTRAPKEIHACFSRAVYVTIIAIIAIITNTPPPPRPYRLTYFGI